MKIFEQVSFYTDLYKLVLKEKYLSNKTDKFKSNESIPKIIHYCWFGQGKYSELIERCIRSWQEFLPGYKLFLWNEDNFPLDKYRFAYEAYNMKKYAFVSDVARLYALNKYGGIYLDTDVEIFKSLDEFLNHGVFLSYESPNLMSSALIGARRGNPFIKLLLKWYDNRHFSEYDMTTANTRIISKITAAYYGIKLNGKPFSLPNEVIVYPADFFPARDQVTINSYCVHHFTGSWKGI